MESGENCIDIQANSDNRKINIVVSEEIKNEIFYGSDYLISNENKYKFLYILFYILHILLTIIPIISLVETYLNHSIRYGILTIAICAIGMFELYKTYDTYLTYNYYHELSKIFTKYAMDIINLQSYSNTANIYIDNKNMLNFYDIENNKYKFFIETDIPLGDIYISLEIIDPVDSVSIPEWQAKIIK